MQAQYDYFNRLEKPSITLANPNREELFSLDLCYNTSLILRYNALSELEFTFSQSIDGGTTTLAAYAYIKNKRLVKVENVGWFQITACPEDRSGSTPTKTVKCSSQECELISKRITSFSGTYQFYNSLDPNGTLLGEILKMFPSWSVGTIDTELELKFRTFNVDDATAYGFLMNQVSTSYGCIFSFDTFNKTISASLINNSTTQTDIYLSLDNLIKNSSFNEISEEITTVLSCYGADPLDIRTVNPLGSAKIYNFDYYMTSEWMDQDLIDALNAWKTKYNAQQLIYANHLTELKNANDTLISLQSGLASLQEQYDSLDGVRKVRIEQGLDISATTTQINAVQTQIATQNTQISNQTNNINDLINILNDINDDLSIFDDQSPNFTLNQQQRLSNFVFENVYQNENIIQTDLMTNSEIQDQAQELFDQSMEVLSRIAYPRYEFDIDAVNFVALKEFQTFTNQLNLGSVITVDLGDGVSIETVVLEISMNLDDLNDFSLSLSNRLRLDNGKYRYSDLQDQIQKASTSTSFNSQAWGNWENNYKNDVTDFISSALNTANNELINSSDQEIVINQNGLKGRKLVSTDPVTGLKTYEPTQLWVTSSIIAFTDNNWNSSKLALGRITSPNGNSTFGLVADTLVGRIIAGNELIIQSSENVNNEGRSFLFNSQGAFLNNASLSISSPNNRINLDPTSGLKVQTLIGGSWGDRLFIDTSGNLTMSGRLIAASGEFSGTIQASSGTIGGFQINPSGYPQGIYTTDHSNYLRANGDFKWGNLTVTGGIFNFNGTINANQIVGQIQDTQIGSGLNAGKVTTGTMYGNRISGGTVEGVTLHWPGGTISNNNGRTDITAQNNITFNVSGTSPFVLAGNYVNIRGVCEVNSTFACYGNAAFSGGLNYSGSVNGYSPYNGDIYVGPSYSNKRIQVVKGMVVNVYLL